MSQNPFGLDHLLPAGAVILKLSIADQLLVRSTIEAEDDWDRFEPSSFLPCVTSTGDDTFLRQLDFLSNNEFIRATYRLLELKTLHIRIYFVPFDLPNVQGRLRIRDEAVMAPARKYLRELLPRAFSWECSGSSLDIPQYLISRDVVAPPFIRSDGHISTYF
jgi:hypothetical protein